MHRPDGSDRLLTLGEAALRLRVSRRTISGWVGAGRLRAVRLSPRCVRIEVAELARFVAESKR